MSDQIVNFFATTVQYVYMIGAIAFFVLQFYEKFRPIPIAEAGTQGAGGGAPAGPQGGFDLQNVMKTAMSNLGPMLQQMGQGGGVPGVHQQSGQGVGEIMDIDEDDDAVANALLEKEFQ